MSPDVMHLAKGYTGLHVYFIKAPNTIIGHKIYLKIAG